MLHPQLQESFVPSVPITVCGQAPPQIYPEPKFAVSSVKFIMRFEVILRLTAPYVVVMLSDHAPVIDLNPQTAYIAVIEPNVEIIRVVTNIATIIRSDAIYFPFLLLPYYYCPPSNAETVNVSKLRLLQELWS